MIVNTLERLIILVVAIVGLVFIYGTLSMAWADDRPNHESTKIYELRINGNLEPSAIFATKEECEREGAKVRNFVCIPGRGVRPEHH